MGLNRGRSSQVVDAVGVVVAMMLAALVNIAVARHYRRWDLTSQKLYTLSPATVLTLRELGERVQIDVLLSASDPLANSVKFLLSAYQAESDKLDVRYVESRSPSR